MYQVINDDLENPERPGFIKQLIKWIANIFIKIHKKGRVLGGLTIENIDIMMKHEHEKE